MTTERFTFGADVQRLLHLVVNSLYSEKSIFLRELISNASDALDKRRFEALTNPDMRLVSEPCITLQTDPKGRVLRIIDNGIGMSRDELVDNIGTIAKSGTKQFLESLKGSGTELRPEGLIGQFGVGLYSAFMAAKSVSIISRRLGEDAAYRWCSDGSGEYTIEDSSRDEPGTTVELELLDIDRENGIDDFTSPEVLRKLVKHHSDFVSYPIRLLPGSDESLSDDDDTDEGKEDVRTDLETLNSMNAIWARPQSQVEADEYEAFYRHLSHDWEGPMEVIAASMEGALQAALLLFLPKHAPLDLYQRERASGGVHLYVKRVFIANEPGTLLPEWLRFVTGVVDCEDLSLNVSRETLQQDRQLGIIRKFATKKVLDALDALAKKRHEDMLTLWTEFGPVLKEGLTVPNDFRERLLDLLLCQSSNSDELVSLDEYVNRMKPDQEYIFYLTGRNLSDVIRSPHLEAFQKKHFEVLFFTDPPDEFWLQNNPSFRGKAFANIGKGEVNLDSVANTETAEQKKVSIETEHYADLLETLKRLLKNEVKDVRLSGRLIDSPACLVGETQDLTPQMEEMLRRMGQPLPATKRILEINADHPMIESLRALRAKDSDNPAVASYARLLFGQAVLAEGGSLRDSAEYAHLVSELMTEAVKKHSGLP